MKSIIKLSFVAFSICSNFTASASYFNEETQSFHLKKSSTQNNQDNFLNGEYQIKRLSSDDVCGTLEFSQDHSDLVKINKFKLSGNHYHEIVKENLFNHLSTDLYSLEYGECQISRFTLFALPNETFYLEAFPNNPLQYAQRVTWDSGNDLNNMDIRLIVDSDGNHEFYVEYPYGKTTRSENPIGISAAQRFLISNNKKQNLFVHNN